MSLTTLEPAPYRNRMVAAGGFIAKPWQSWIEQSLVQRIQATAPNVAAVTADDQTDAIGATPALESAQGFYRVNWYIRIVSGDVTSSSVQIGVLSTDGGVAVAQAGPALVSNAAGEVASGVFLVNCDAGSPLSIATNYATVGGTPMSYSLIVLIEGLQ